MNRLKSLLKGERLFILLSILIIVIGGIGVYYYNKYQKTKNLLENLNATSKDQTAVIIAKVSKLILLPTGEQPTVATVTNVEKLRNQPFFANAKNGDKVLVYTNAKKAFLYDPIANKIVDVAPVNVGPTPTASASPSPSPTTVIVVPTKEPSPTTPPPTATPLAK